MKKKQNYVSKQCWHVLFCFIIGLSWPSSPSRTTCTSQKQSKSMLILLATLKFAQKIVMDKMHGSHTLSHCCPLLNPFLDFISIESFSKSRHKVNYVFVYNPTSSAQQWNQLAVAAQSNACQQPWLAKATLPPWFWTSIRQAKKWPNLKNKFQFYVIWPTNHNNEYTG
jgi:hypothetical protein